ncbi:response regulator [Mesorhizobium sp. L-8-10]|uniref:response regulator transcription factor n=1 Tax=Mesorhizobium sp. L-8-10 TaxID=2744523 RepID=UPI001925D2AD|nr:response regulator [Mesorhizobium sp. L-8-10]BCH28841.1 response regulator [Mesorhizobium sp. L-8-10]
MSRELLIAVVDDDESFRTALIDSLGSLGYAARGFTSADDFLAGQADASSNCVITDVHMPGMSGLDLARLLAGRRRKMPVILVTARSEPGIDDRAAESGAICLLRKPFKTRELMTCLEKALRP